MHKVKGGPKTLAGKSISSQNAVKHGALSSKFQAPYEQKQYAALLKSLKAQYKQSHPIIKLQLERVASLTVQLDRIQRSIDSVYTNSESLEIKAQRVGRYLGMTDSEISSIALLNMNKDRLNLNKLNKKISLIVQELSAIAWEDFNSQKEFLDSTPLFCSYLATSAHQSNYSVNDWRYQLESHLEKDFLEDETKSRLAKMFGESSPAQNENDDLQDLSLIETLITKANPNIIKEMARVMIDWHKKMMESTYQKMMFHHLMQMQDNAIGLNLDDLDKLYRYQTSVQRQLSSAIGELMVLDKNLPKQ